MTSKHSQLTADDLWEDIIAVRKQTPLVHSITNFVVMSYNANILLALGASPVMAHALEEVEEMTSIANALVLNIGTLEPAWIRSMQHALKKANSLNTPVILDPVGAGATTYRNQALQAIFACGHISVIRGNASEIMSVAGLTITTRGVDSASSSNEAVQAAKQLAHSLSGTVCVSGADDHVIDQNGRWLSLSNGHEWMTRITGVGCSATAMIGAFAAVQPDYWRATAAAMAYLGVVGEWAREAVMHEKRGVGTLQIRILDGLQLMEKEEFMRRLKMSIHT